ncbi:MAG: tetratricopeptide (TPR) repeat protein [Polaribacter sp.]|jgi:tetratricopeptide (TPR) repeat protein
MTIKKLSKSLFCVAALVFATSPLVVFSAEDKNKEKKPAPKIEIIVPVTKLTKSCKPLINKSLKLPKVPIRGLSERSSKRINRALEKMAEEKYDEALELFLKLLNSSKDQNVKAITARYIGYLYAQQSKTDGAMKYFSMALDLGKGYLQHKDMQDLTQNVASMLFSADKKKDSLNLLERWLKNSKVNNHNVFLLYSAILEDTGKSRESICPAYWAAKVSPKPNKNAFQLMLQGHFNFKDMDGAQALLIQLIKYFPEDKGNWRNLSSIYMQQDNTSDALAVMELFYVQGMMEKESDYKQLSAIFAWSEIPLRTAQILKEGIDKKVVEGTEKNWKNVGANFHIAQEINKSVYAYGKAGEKAKDGENELKQGELLADDEQFKKAIVKLDVAIKKGVKDEGKVHYRKGLAYLGLKQYSRAITHLGNATKYKKWRKRSVQWSGYAKTQKKNAAKL